MSGDNLARLRVATLISCMVNAVLFGAGVITVLSVPALSKDAFFWIPAVVLASFVLSPPLSWFIAPSMMQRFLQAKLPPLTARLARQIDGSADAGLRRA